MTSRPSPREPSTPARSLAELLASIPFEAAAVRVVDRGDRGPVVHALRVWPSPRSAFYGLAPGRWTPGPVCAAGALLASPYSPHIDDPELDGWDVDLRALLARIPDEVREVLEPLPRVFGWLVLEMVRMPEARELAREAPVLAGLLAFTVWSAGGSRMSAQLRPLLHQPRRRLLPLLGLPDAAWIVRALTRMDPGVLRDPGHTELIELLATANRETLRRLQHLSALPSEVVEILANRDWRDMATFRLLDEAASGDPQLPRQLEALQLAGCRRRFRSRAAISAAWLDLEERRRREWSPADHEGAFRTPTGEITLPGEPPLTLRPVRTAEEMLQAGRSQYGCIPTDYRYPGKALSGEGAMYLATLDPGAPPITVWLERGSRGCRTWGLRELARPNNRPVEPEIESRLHAWVATLPVTGGSGATADAAPPQLFQPLAAAGPEFAAPLTEEEAEADNDE